MTLGYSLFVMRKQIHLGVLFISILLVSCGGGRMTYEEVQKEISQAEAAQQKAKEETNEAIAAREQYYRDYQAAEIEKYQKKIKSLDKQIEKIERQKKATTNKEAAKSLDDAISSLKEERNQYQEEIARLKSMTFKDWSEAQQKVNQNFSENNEVLNSLEQSLESK